jgi:hypothetical protein
MRIARVSLGASARGMTQRDEVASPRPAESEDGTGGQPAGRVYLRTPARADRAEFVSLMRASRAFHRPWATAPTDDEAFDAYLLDSRRPDFEAMLVCRRSPGSPRNTAGRELRPVADGRRERGARPTGGRGDRTARSRGVGGRVVSVAASAARGLAARGICVARRARALRYAAARIPSPRIFR